ncbi:hydroxyproline-rich glycoprotein family protein [Striga hermonthica]|uniref:Hydroxyproline-rich glycoprotein family protein n=1 Tax=Striga hermonthica TaxID=68872 RepID=A0A9N7MN50_STRHE|nr:hydroxyproline-rich glycoprotein family protein [Striga hermonthica]
MVTEINEKYAADRTLKRQGSVQGIVTHADESCNVDGSEIIKVSPRTFVANEICEGKLVNVAEGMKLYDDLFEDSEISKLSTLVKWLRASGKRGHLKGQAFTTLRRPMRGRGREIIQFGVPIADANPDNEEASVTSRDIKTEPIPELLQDIIQRLLAEQVVSVKPDSVIIDVFNESQPKKLNADAQGFPPPPSNWAPPPSHIRQGTAKHFGPIPPTPGPRPQPNNCIQPMFVPGPVKPSFPPPVPQAPSWPAGPPPRLPLPGTGVFIPPQGSGNTSGQQTSSTENMGLETISARSEENGGKKLNDGHGLQDKRECNGTVVKNGEEFENTDAVQGGK